MIRAAVGLRQGFDTKQEIPIQEQAIGSRKCGSDLYDYCEIWEMTASHLNIYIFHLNKFFFDTHVYWQTQSTIYKQVI